MHAACRVVWLQTFHRCLHFMHFRILVENSVQVRKLLLERVMVSDTHPHLKSQKRPRNGSPPEPSTQPPCPPTSTPIPVQETHRELQAPHQHLVLCLLGQERHADPAEVDGPVISPAARPSSAAGAQHGHHLLHPGPQKPGRAGVTLHVGHVPFPPCHFLSLLAASWVQRSLSRFPPADGPGKNVLSLWPRQCHLASPCLSPPSRA